MGGSVALRSSEHFGEVSRRSPRQVGGHLPLSLLLWLGATSRPPAPVPRPFWTEKAGMGRVSGADAWGTGFRGWGPRGLGRAWEEMGARLGPERPELLLPLLPLPFRQPSLALSLCPAAVPEAARLGSCRRSPAAARPPRPAWARQAERGKSERRGGVAGRRGAGAQGNEAMGSRGGSGPRAGATLAIVVERGSVGLCIPVERTRWLWEDGGGSWCSWAPRSPLGTRDGGARAKETSPLGE